MKLRIAQVLEKWTTRALASGDSKLIIIILLFANAVDPGCFANIKITYYLRQTGNYPHKLI